MTNISFETNWTIPRTFNSIKTDYFKVYFHNVLVAENLHWSQAKIGKVLKGLVLTNVPIDLQNCTDRFDRPIKNIFEKIAVKTVPTTRKYLFSY